MRIRKAMSEQEFKAKLEGKEFMSPSCEGMVRIENGRVELNGYQDVTDTCDWSKLMYECYAWNLGGAYSKMTANKKEATMKTAKSVSEYENSWTANDANGQPLKEGDTIRANGMSDTDETAQGEQTIVGYSYPQLKVKDANGEVGYVTPGSCVKVGSKKTASKFHMNTYDVWGNEEDGFVVNDAFNKGTLEIPEGATDEQLLAACVEANLIPADAVSQLEYDNSISDEAHIYFKWANNSEPAFELIADEVVSHDPNTETSEPITPPATASLKTADEYDDRLNKAVSDFSQRMDKEDAMDENSLRFSAETVPDNENPGMTFVDVKCTGPDGTVGEFGGWYNDEEAQRIKNEINSDPTFSAMQDGRGLTDGDLAYQAWQEFKSNGGQLSGVVASKKTASDDTPNPFDQSDMLNPPDMVGPEDCKYSAVLSPDPENPGMAFVDVTCITLDYKKGEWNEWYPEEDAKRMVDAINSMNVSEELN